MGVCFGGLCGTTAENGIRAGILNFRMCGISHSRNQHVHEVLAAPQQFTHLLWIDSDMAFPTDALVRLLAHDKDIVGAFYMQKAEPYKIVGRPKDLSDTSITGLKEAELLGGGFVLVKREVYEKIPYPWYEERHTPPREFISEDVMFCHKCRAAGIEMWADMDLSLEMGHSGNHLIRFGPPSQVAG
jgi:hypothetical protein